MQREIQIKIPLLVAENCPSGRVYVGDPEKGTAIMVTVEDEDPVQVYGPLSCPHPCSECPDGKHHWIEEYLDLDDEAEVVQFDMDCPGARSKIPHFDTLMDFYGCKHCDAVAVDKELLADAATDQRD